MSSPAASPLIIAQVPEVAGSDGATCLTVLVEIAKGHPIPLFHAPVVEGGLRVLFHEHIVPLMLAKRLSRSDESPDPVIAQYQPTTARPCGCTRLA